MSSEDPKESAAASHVESDAAGDSEAATALSVAAEGGEGGESAGAAGTDDHDAEIEAMRQRVAEMEEEARKIEAATNGGNGAAAAAASPVAAASAGRPTLTAEQTADIDSRSIHVSQVDYSVTEDELKKLFEACGAVNRVTILKDKFTGQPKGFAYIEFASAESINNAMILNETEFKGRTLKIAPKRTNIPGYGRGGRGGAPRGRGGMRGGYGGGYEYGPIRGRGGRGGRGRGRGGYHPYQQYQY